MRDDLCGLRLGQTTIHRPVQVLRNLRDLAGSSQGADSHQTAVPGRKVRTQPEVTEQYVGGVLDDSRNDRTELATRSFISTPFGYEDASHFNREYKRHFGEPPMRDVERLRGLATA